MADWLRRERRLGCLEVLCPEKGRGWFQFCCRQAALGVLGGPPCGWTFALGTPKRAVWPADRDLGDAHAGLVTESPEWIGLGLSGRVEGENSGPGTFTGWAKTPFAVSEGWCVSRMTGSSEVHSHEGWA